MSPVPAGMAPGIRVYRPGRDVRTVADAICDRAWKGLGVRVYAWPCGTIALVTVGSRGDLALFERSPDALFATYARHAITRVGPMRVDVLHDMGWARAHQQMVTA